MRCVPFMLSTAFSRCLFLFQRLRPMSYSKSHVILIAFALDTPDSLENVTTKAYIILKCTALFMISLFPLSGSKKLEVSVVLPFPSSLLDAKLIYDHQPLIPIPRITLVRGLLGKEGNERPSQSVPEHTKSARH